MDKIPYWHISNLDYLFLTDIGALKKELLVMREHLNGNQDLEIEDYEGTGHIFSEETALLPLLIELSERIKEDELKELLKP